MDYENDLDYFTFRAEEGTFYKIDVALGTLDDSEVTLYDADRFEIEYNDDYEDSTASRIFWEAPAAGVYYVRLEGDLEFDLGSYTLTVAEYVVESAWKGDTDYDTDNDGFIEVSNLAQLNAIRWDLDGSGLPEHPPNNPLYAEAFPNAADRMGCPDKGRDGQCSGYELTADLDFDTNGNGSADSGDAYWNDGLGWDPIGWDEFLYGEFTGFFEGRGHTISNLYINRSDTDHVGLFGRAGTSGRNRFAFWVDIRDVGLIDVQVLGRAEVGGLVGQNSVVAVAACYVTGSVTGNREVGGLVGSNFYGSVAASYAAVSVTGDREVGGLVGQNFGGHIWASYSAGTVTGNSEVGGLVGENTFGRGTATDSYWDIPLSGQSDSADGEGKTTVELQSPTDYTGIYENWNVDLGDDRPAGGPGTWDFGTMSQYPMLQPPIVATTQLAPPAAALTPTPSADTTSSGATPVAQMPSADRDSLVALYEATGGANWENSHNWLSEATLGEWFGVTTDAMGRVTELNLWVNQLSGEIPAELGDLTKLKWLDLYNNELSGEIPAEVGGLTNLKGLILADNELSGEIPAELGDLTNLTELYLWGNELSGCIPAVLRDVEYSDLDSLGLPFC